MRILLLLLVCGSVLGQSAQSRRYDALMAEAMKLQRERRWGEPADQPFVRAYEKLAEACLADDSRHEAFFARGMNRCDLTVVLRSMLAHGLNALRISGGTAEALAETERRGAHYMGEVMGMAERNFAKMHHRMRAKGLSDPQLLKFAVASLKYARADYLGSNGKPGAIADLKACFEARSAKDWRKERCAELVAQCYKQLGAIAYVRTQSYEQAQEYWDEALKWAQSPAARRSILTNKAGAYEAAGSYGLAKEILRKQIAREPRLPAPWKNLGLLLGFEGKLREALHAYGQTRTLCKRASQAEFNLGQLHGSAWLKAANIHGTLLLEDGDLVLAWTLFLRYRQMFGDNYNFCVDFGRFALELGQYEIAYAYLIRARDLQPFCRMPYLLLIRVSQRLSRPPDEVRKLAAEASRSAVEAKARYNHHETESPSVQRLCAGNIDRSDGSPVPGTGERLTPDPLAGMSEERPPEWILQAAQQRRPFEPWEPAEQDPSGDLASRDVDLADGAPAWPWAAAGGLLLLAFGALTVLRRGPESAPERRRLPPKDG